MFALGTYGRYKGRGPLAVASRGSVFDPSARSKRRQNAQESSSQGVYVRAQLRAVLATMVGPCWVVLGLLNITKQSRAGKLILQ